MLPARTKCSLVIIKHSVKKGAKKTSLLLWLQNLACPAGREVCSPNSQSHSYVSDTAEPINGTEEAIDSFFVYLLVSKVHCWTKHAIQNEDNR